MYYSYTRRRMHVSRFHSWDLRFKGIYNLFNRLQAIEQQLATIAYSKIQFTHQNLIPVSWYFIRKSALLFTLTENV